MPVGPDQRKDYDNSSYGQCDSSVAPATGDDGNFRFGLHPGIGKADSTDYHSDIESLDRGDILGNHSIHEGGPNSRINKHDLHKYGSGDQSGCRTEFDGRPSEVSERSHFIGIVQINRLVAEQGIHVMEVGVAAVPLPHVGELVV